MIRAAFSMTVILRSHSYPGSVDVQLLLGDITQVEADGIVNPANSQLAHGGGLAGVLSRKAGPTLQAESSAWIREHGPVSHHEPAYTGAGELPFKAVIHAVGPVWGSGEENRKLKAAVLGSLERAQQLELSSLAIPAISTGIFGFPLREAAEVILSAVQEYASRAEPRGLNKIIVVLYDDRAAAAFTGVWDRIIR